VKSFHTASARSGRASDRALVLEAVPGHVNFREPNLKLDEFQHQQPALSSRTFELSHDVQKVQLRVGHGRSNVAMPHGLSDNSDVHPAQCQLAAECVSKPMRRRTFQQRGLGFAPRFTQRFCTTNKRATHNVPECRAPAHLGPQPLTSSPHHRLRRSVRPVQLSSPRG